MREAGADNSINWTGISAVCSGFKDEGKWTRKTAGGYEWRYADQE